MEKKTYYRFENQSENSNDFVLKERTLYGANKNCFKSKEEAELHFKNAEIKSLEKYEKIIDGINKLKQEFDDFSLECYAWVLDDSGLETSVYIEFNIDGYDFKFIYE